MDSRAEILNKLKASVTGSEPPSLPHSGATSLSFTESFKTVLASIGGSVVELADYNQIAIFIKDNYRGGSRIISCIEQLTGIERLSAPAGSPHEYHDVHLAILQGEFAVAENGAVWLTDASLPHRVLPFIAEHLLVIIPASAIVHTMHDAYDRIGNSPYEFGIFIAGPSKTADIEQSLVLGAHGPKSMTVVLM
jgi:L-lactate dehydrogenase complex protein LldG